MKAKGYKVSTEQAQVMVKEPLGHFLVSLRLTKEQDRQGHVKEVRPEIVYLDPGESGGADVYYDGEDFWFYDPVQGGYYSPGLETFIPFPPGLSCFFGCILSMVGPQALLAATVYCSTSMALCLRIPVPKLANPACYAMALCIIGAVGIGIYCLIDCL